VAHITGLNNFSIPQPMVTQAQAGDTNANVLGSGPGGAYLASDMRAAYYGGRTLTGLGQCVGLFEFSTYSMADVQQTMASAGQTLNVPVNNVIPPTSNNLQYHEIDSSVGDAEPVLDIVQAIGMAPGLDQVRVYIGVTKTYYEPITTT